MDMVNVEVIFIAKLVATKAQGVNKIFTRFPAWGVY